MDQDQQTVDTPCSTQDECHTPRSRNSRGDRGPKSRRASLACLACRTRKVRCDVMQQWPCANCRWHKKECVVRQHGNNNRSRLHRLAPNQTPSSDLTKSDYQPGTSSGPTSPEGENLLQMLSTGTGDQDQELLTTSTPTETTNAQLCEGIPSDLTDCTSGIILPIFIKQLPVHISADDFTFLKSKGAFNLPSLDLQDALLRAYFEHVHPCLPILDLESFLECVTAVEAIENKISLPLFHAVLSAGTSYVDMKLLTAAGFRSRKEASNMYFRRVQLLHDFGYETNRLILVQILLLLTFWGEAPDRHRSTWHWMDNAISQAFIAELNLDIASRSKFSQKQRRLRRRIWWSCLIRDRLVSMGTKRPHGIRDDDYNVAMMEETDFEFGNGQENCPGSYLSLCPYFQSRDMRERLAEICISLARLCKRLKYSFGINQTAVSNKQDAGDGVSRLIPIDGTSFAACHHSLMEWHDSLPLSIKHHLILPDQMNSSADASIAIHRAVLHMIYHTVLLGLHRSRFVVLHNNPQASAFERELSRVFIQHSAKHISAIEKNVSECGLANLLPPVAIASTGWAAIVHLLESKGILQENAEGLPEGSPNLLESADNVQTSLDHIFSQNPNPIFPGTPVSEKTTPPSLECNQIESQNIICMHSADCETYFNESMDERMPTPETWSDVPMLEQFEEWLECSIGPAMSNESAEIWA